jgi:RNA polymerase sigma-70 factor, ECF subfamily
VRCTRPKTRGGRGVCWPADSAPCVPCCCAEPANRRSSGPPNDTLYVSEQPAAAVPDQGATLLDLYDSALPYVYGYLLARCGRPALAEDLTAETLLGAVDSIRRRQAPGVSVPWLIGIARHKLVDHWRREARLERSVRALSNDAEEAEDPWDVELDALAARAALKELAPQHRAALTLRYLDDLPVPEVAVLLDRTVHATEALLVRARLAFRRVYVEGEAGNA